MKYFYISVLEKDLQTVLDENSVKGYMLKFCFPFQRFDGKTTLSGQQYFEYGYNLIFELVN